LALQFFFSLSFFRGCSSVRFLLSFDVGKVRPSFLFSILHRPPSFSKFLSVRRPARPFWFLAPIERVHQPTPFFPGPQLCPPPSPRFFIPNPTMIFSFFFSFLSLIGRCSGISLVRLPCLVRSETLMPPPFSFVHLGRPERCSPSDNLI